LFISCVIRWYFGSFGLFGYSVILVFGSWNTRVLKLTNSDNDSTISPISGQPKHTPLKINFVKLVECVDCGENEKQAEKPTSFTQNPKGIGQRETRTVWDNTARVNHQNKLTHPHPKRNFVPATILTMSRQVPINAAKQSSYKAAASVSAVRRVNTAAPRPNVNSARPNTTQDLVIIKLIHKVKRLERELKSRTPPTKIQKMKYWHRGYMEQARFKREQRIVREKAAEQEATCRFS
nr:hypothetical protein [Tanacetum cinerariifolium]